MQYVSFLRIEDLFSAMFSSVTSALRLLFQILARRFPVSPLDLVICVADCSVS